MLGLFKKKNMELYSPVKGESVDIANVNDAVFRDELLGKVMAVKPGDSKLFSPLKGEVTMIFKTLHAIGIKGDNGEEVLMHIGLDTVKLNGEGFKCFVKVGDRVDTKTLLFEVDFELIEEKGYDNVVLLVLTNSDKFSNYKLNTGKIRKGDSIFSFE